MKKQVTVIGLGRFGFSLACSLFDMGHDVLAMDTNETAVQTISSRVTHAVQADATNEAILKDLGIANFDVGIVAVGSEIQNSVLSTILLKKLGVPYVIAKAENELHGTILGKIGADKVVYPEREAGVRVAHELTLPHVLDYITVSPTYGVAKLTAPAYFVGKTLAELELGRGGRWDVAVLLIKREKEVVVTPDRSEVVKQGDVLILSGNDDKLEQLLTEAESEAEGE